MALDCDQDLRSLVPVLRPDLTDRIASIQVERISPKMSSQTRPGTMSAIYGMGAFPLHSERAHWRVPPRFLIFRSAGDLSDRPTTLFDSHCFARDRVLAQELLQTPWIVRWGEVSFRSPVLRVPSGGVRPWYVRYDRCCMTTCDQPRNGLAERLECALAAAEPEYHHWLPGIVLLVDNWRVLHGRGESSHSDWGRVLERVVVP